MSRSQSHECWCRWIVLLLVVTSAACKPSPTSSSQRSRAEMIEVDKYLGPISYLTFAESLEQVRLHQRATKDAMSQNRPDDAHAAMHALVNLVESLPMSAQNSRLSEEVKQRVQAAADVLGSAVGKLDAAMHTDSEPVTYEDVADEIDRGMRMLNAIEAELPRT